MKKILLVDDNEVFRQLIEESLQHAGYDVQCAADGVEALKVYRQHAFDLVVTDLVMPEKEGLETIMELRKLQPAVKIIAISGTPYLPLASKLGATKTLLKPFTPSQLIQEIEQF